MAKKTKETLQRQVFEQRSPLIHQISDCTNLSEIQSLVEQLILEYGGSATLHFDAGHNNISEEIVVTRTETDEEFNLRIDREVETKLLQKVAQDVHLNKDIALLLAAKAPVKK